MNISPKLFVELLKLKKIRDLDQRDGECRLENVDWRYLFVLRESNIAITI